VTIPNPEHLFDQADKLISPGLARPSRQTDLRRAVSAAYYGLFHTCLIAAADEFAGIAWRTTARYALIYRSVDHRTLREVCGEVKKQTPSARYAPYTPPGGFDAHLRDFSEAALSLQLGRHDADYNPQSALTRSSFL
jgi:hypothetical protein